MTLDILVLGATGITGRQTALYLAKHPDRKSFTFGIAGRSKSKLDKIAEELGVPDLPAFVFDVTDEEQVNRVVQNAKIIINTVGPFWKWGTPVVRACVSHNIHYVDLTGEFYWIAKIIRECDYAATKNGTIIVPSCGFDSVPSDLSVYLARKTLNSVSPNQRLDIDTSVTAFRLSGGISGGTLASVVTVLDDLDEITQSNRKYPLSPVEGVPSSKPQLTYWLQIPDTGRWLVGGYWFMRSSNRAIVQRSWGLWELEASNKRDDKAELARYGPTFKYDEFHVMPNRLVAMMLTIGLGLGALLVTSFSPFKWLFKCLVPSPGQGPKDEVLHQGFIKLTNITSVVTSPPQRPIQVKTTINAKGDPGYLLSPYMVAESALCIHFSKDSLPDMAKRGGVLTPSTAFGDVLVERLRKIGFEITSSVVSMDKKTL